MSDNLSEQGKFDVQHRAIYDGHDEHFSTATLREFFKPSVVKYGEIIKKFVDATITSKTKQGKTIEKFHEGRANQIFTEMDPKSQNTLKRLLEDYHILSQLRLRTEYTFFVDVAKNKNRVMIHPTAKKAKFPKEKLRDQQHGKFDRLRASRALNAMEEALNGGKKNRRDILRAGAIEASMFTINYVPPAAAANIEPNLSKHGKENRLKQTNKREEGKDFLAKLGVDQAPGTQELDSPFHQSDKNCLSPRRTDRKSLKGAAQASGMSDPKEKPKKPFFDKIEEEGDLIPPYKEIHKRAWELGERVAELEESKEELNEDMLLLPFDKKTFFRTLRAVFYLYKLADKSHGKQNDMDIDGEPESAPSPLGQKPGHKRKPSGLEFSDSPAKRARDKSSNVAFEKTSPRRSPSRDKTVSLFHDAP